MKEFPKKLQQKISERTANNALRSLGTSYNLIDFSSNDYLGFAKAETIFEKAHQFLIDNNNKQNGATGSRLLSGNYPLYNEVEEMLCDFHKSEAALIFNSGYDANIGFFSSIPQRGDIILYDELIHASIRDGIKMSSAKSYKFAHNDLEDLAKKCRAEHSRGLPENEIYIVTESVFSMDGDSPNLKEFSKICKKHGTHLIIDEAHAVGVLGNRGAGLVQELGLEKEIFARLITFGKALGCHGAAILGSKELKQYLINFSRSFIYTTGLPPHSLATIKASYNVMLSAVEAYKELHSNIQHFKAEVKLLKLNFIESESAIHCCIIQGNETVRSAAQKLKQNGFDIKPILSPTVPQGKERLRFCLHAYNSKKQITKVLEKLATFVSESN